MVDLPSEKSWSESQLGYVGMMTFPAGWEVIKAMFQTTKAAVVCDSPWPIGVQESPGSSAAAAPRCLKPGRLLPVSGKILKSRRRSVQEWHQCLWKNIQAWMIWMANQEHMREIKPCCLNHHFHPFSSQKSAFTDRTTRKSDLYSINPHCQCWLIPFLLK